MQALRGMLLQESCEGAFARKALLHGDCQFSVQTLLGGRTN